MLNEWGNFKTRKKELFEKFPPIGRLKEFIPQDYSAQGNYSTLISFGSNPIEAFYEVLKSCHRERIGNGNR